MEKTFEENLKELENVVASLESSDLSLDEALDKFKKGIELTKNCSKKLEDAENKIKILIDGKEEDFEVE